MTCSKIFERMTADERNIEGSVLYSIGYRDILSRYPDCRRYCITRGTFNDMKEIILATVGGLIFSAVVYLIVKFVLWVCGFDD